jgi:hypothetical protein
MKLAVSTLNLAKFVTRIRYKSKNSNLDLSDIGLSTNSINIVIKFINDYDHFSKIYLGKNNLGNNRFNNLISFIFLLL